MITAEQKEMANSLARLCACSINGTKPDPEWVAGLNLEQLYRMANYHHLSCIVACALEKAGVTSPEFKAAKGKALARVVTMDVDRISLCAKLDAAGIRYMPLKGSILKNLYPEIGMREMSDNDILIDGGRAGEVRGIMESLGFETIEFDHEVRDVYHKKPVSSFELHRRLFSSKLEVFEGYYRNIWDRLVKDEGNGSGYHFTLEDYYIFMLAHEFKHYDYGGTGLRSLLDEYVYLLRYRDEMDREYLDAELKKLGIDEFERVSSALAFRFFDGEPIVDEEETELLEDMLRAGTYGTKENEYRKQIKRQSGAKAVFRQIFPTVEYMRKAVGFVDKCVLLYPLGVVWRWIRILLKSRKKIRLFFRALRNERKDKACKAQAKKQQEKQ